MGNDGALAGVEKPSWGKTVGVYFGSLLIIGFAGYSVGGILSWLAALLSASYYRSTGKAGSAAGIAFVVGIVIGIIVVAVGPTAIAMRYGAV